MTSQKQKIGNWLKNSITAKMITVGFLILILLIPLSFVGDLIRERGYRQTEVVEEINTKWGKEVVVYGPILKIPYQTYIEEKVFDEKTKTFLKTLKTQKHNAYFFPEELNIDSNAKTQPLERGIYESVVYMAEMKIDGKFINPDFSRKEQEQEDILSDKETLLNKTNN